jgi:hypothetical protein
MLFLEKKLESCIKCWTRGIVYKFALLEGPKNSKVWESYPNFNLAHPILAIPMALQRRHFIVLQAKISYLEGTKFHKYIRRNVFHEDKLQIKGLKGT